MNVPGADDRDFDIVVQGATGFTGALVAEYLLATYGIDGDIRWAIAGRSESKLRNLCEQLGEDAGELSIIVADSTDRDALTSMARRTRVVLTTVGPYALYGSDLVAACVSTGTHYCDLAGEVQWIREMIDTHQADAERTGARIVHCCGFDSIPMDIGVYALQGATKDRYGEYCTNIRMLVKATRGAASGGTLASILNLIEQSRADRSVARVLADPYSLNPDGQRQGPDGRDQQKPVYDDDAGCWTAPFVMAGVNTKVVRRGHALLDYPYGKDFRYSEAIMTGRGFGGWLKAAMVTVGLGGFFMLATFAPTRRFLQRFVLTKPGDGPDREARENGFFNLQQIGTLPDGRVVRGRITGDRDPGYGSTSKMLSEAAVCLAKDPIEIPGGFWTPSSAMGSDLLDRLQKNAGLTFELLD